MDLLNISDRIASDIQSEIDDSYLKVDTSKKIIEAIGNDPLVQDTLIKLANKFNGIFESNTKFKYFGEFKSSNLNVLRKIPVYVLKDDAWFFKNKLVEKLLEDPNCPIEVLERMSKDENLYTRIKVARHPNCPEEVLERLSKDPDYLVRQHATEYRYYKK